MSTASVEGDARVASPRASHVGALLPTSGMSAGAASAAAAPLLLLAVLMLTGVRQGPGMMRWETALAAVLIGVALSIRLGSPGTRRWTWLSDLLVLAAMAPTFLLVAEASRLAADGVLDRLLLDADLWLFGEPVAAWFAHHSGSGLFAEWMAGAYLTYYVALPSAWFAAWRTGPDAQRRAINAIVLTFSLATTAELLLPTAGPLPQRAALVPHSGALRWLVDFVYTLDAHGGAAFPSSHVAVGTVCWWVVWQNARRAGWWTLPVLLSLYVSTAQGCFHYSLDIYTGLLVSALAIAVMRTRHPAGTRPRGC